MSKEIIYKCKCGETNSNNFYGHKRSTCKECDKKDIIKRSKINKQKGIDYLGGECKHCGYNKCIEALEYHHTNPLEKDISAAKINYWSEEKRNKELDKCILLCANCHREEHVRLKNI